MKIISVLGMCVVFVVTTTLAPVAWAQDDTIPPVINHVPVDRVEAQQPVEVKAEITDESGIFQPTVYYRKAGTASFSTVTMENKGDHYLAIIPQFVVTGELEYFIEAFDSFGNGPSRVGSPEAPLLIKFGPDPEAIAASMRGGETETTPTDPATEGGETPAGEPGAEVGPTDPGPIWGEEDGPSDEWYMQWYTFAAAGGVILLTGIIIAIAASGKDIYDDQPHADFIISR
jgi:hypothetical protein